MSLRLWGGEIALDEFVARLGLPVRHVHRIGEPMAASGPLAGRLSDQNYASLDDMEGSNAADVAAWIRRVVAAVSPIDALVSHLEAKRIDGVLWIAILGREPTPTPDIETNLVDAVSSLGLRIFLENYSTWDYEGDAPPKIWLPASAAHIVQSGHE